MSSLSQAYLAYFFFTFLDFVQLIWRLFEFVLGLSKISNLLKQGSTFGNIKIDYANLSS